MEIFKFALFDERSSQLLAYVGTVDGLAGETHIEMNGHLTYRVRLINCEIVDIVLKQKITENVDLLYFDLLILRMMDDNGCAITDYQLSDAYLLNYVDNNLDRIELIFSFFMSPLAKPFELELQEIWRLGLRKKNMWSSLDFLHRIAWLQLVSRRHFTQSTNIEDKPANLIYELDGTFITDNPSFFIALGEAINGPGGYFGKCLDSVSDCLCGDFGATTPLTLVWKNSQIAKCTLNEKATREYRLENRRQLLQDLSVDQNEYLTLFEIENTKMTPLFNDLVDFFNLFGNVKLVLD